jgi:heme oxygenase (biliverdin-IX-beta and delta-forming)
MPQENPMDRSVLESIRTLLQTTRVLSLAYVTEAGPEAALLPFAPRGDCGALYVQASALARHAQALRPGAHVGVLVHAQDSDGADAMQLARLSVTAIVSVLDKESAEFEAAAGQFAARFRAARLTLGFGDFNLYALTPGSGRFVQGFARAFEVAPDTFDEIGRL